MSYSGDHYTGIAGRSEFFVTLFRDVASTVDAGDGFDVIYAYDANDTLYGGLGRDVILAEKGNDTVYGDRTEDDEATNADPNLAAGADAIFASFGNDTVYAGGGNNFVNGEDGNDSVTGGSGNEMLAGGYGDDWVSGLGGDDVIYGEDPALWLVAAFLQANIGDFRTDYNGVTDLVDPVDWLAQSFATSDGWGWPSFDDHLDGGDGNDIIYGQEGDDTLIGGAGEDLLDGGTGVDEMAGGAGNDTYRVDSVWDVVDESVAGSGGKDTVRSDKVSINLAYSTIYRGAIESAVLEGSDNLNLTGNIGTNYLQGNRGDNRIDGGLGPDHMVGLLGNDTYYIDTLGDLVDESVSGSGGYDVVRSSTISINLNSTSIKGNIESAVLERRADLDLIGNALENYLQGNPGNNLINGGGGSDTLVGLGGSDTFRFANSVGAGNIDTITDYNVADDQIELENLYFTALTTTGALSASAFTANTTGEATATGQYIIYETDTGKLFYDSNGSFAGGTYQQFAQLAAGLTMSEIEFVVT